MDCWHHEIEKATTEDDVVRSASDYLQLWAPRELDPTQLGLIDMQIDSPDDIERVKRWLSDKEPAAVSPTHSADLKELNGYFWHAASRLGEIRQSRFVR
ncbi:MAG: hypothetical protein H7Y14_02035 [Burkholderiales bacterium]|nr:hypothetical protein [Burkholderiales bacterium]